nr:Ropporin-1A [Polyrhizophydium stewartii]
MSEPLYSAEQIRIPSELPEILKNYAKFIIKSQPADILASSAEYFSRLSKQRTQANGGKRLTNMQLEAFYAKFSTPDDRGTVPRKDIDEAAAAANIPATQVQDVLSCTLMATVELVCELIGDNGRISVPIVQDIAVFLIEQDRTVDPTLASHITRALEALSPRDHPIPQVIEAVRQEIEGKGAADGEPAAGSDDAQGGYAHESAESYPDDSAGTAPTDFGAEAETATGSGDATGDDVIQESVAEEEQ